MKQLTLILAFVLALGLIACSSSSDSTTTTEDPPQNTETAAEAVDAAAEAATTVAAMEVACGACIYKMEGVQGCTAATMVDGTPMLLTGMEIEAHALGLCSEAKTAQMAGRVHGDKFHVTSFTLE